MGDTDPLQYNLPGKEQIVMDTISAPPGQVIERLRVQELLRYFQPPNPSADKNKPQVALDTSLTAYAQLSALKLNCQRSFISLVDHETQYIIAEATRTVMLETGETDAGADDAIYLGTTSLDIFWGVCPQTISVFTALDGSRNINSPYVKANMLYYVMNDLSKVPGYETRPYVVGWPYMRYYAEVPIRSPSGLVIGSLCCVDNKPRKGVDMKDIAILKEISQVVMDHLELVMSKVQRKRAERMIHGLGLFIEGSDSLREWWIDSEKSSRTVDPNKRGMTLDERADKEFGSQESLKVHASQVTATQTIEARKEIKNVHRDLIDATSPPHIIRNVTSPLDILSSSSQTESIPTELRGSSISGEKRTTESNNNTTVNGSMRKSRLGLQNFSTNSAGSIGRGQDQIKIQSEIESMLSRAANLIREAVSFSGVIFFDSQIGGNGKSSSDSSFGGLARKQSSQVDTSSNRYRNLSQKLLEDLDQMSTSTTVIGAPKENFCKVLAKSTRVDCNEDQPSLVSLDMPERILQLLVDKFPQGGILEYDDMGPLSHREIKLTWYQNIPKGNEFVISDIVPQVYPTVSDRSDSEEARFLSRLLLGVRSVLLFPLWDSSRDRLFAYNIAWTTDQNCVFQREDFAYLASFCNSINSELSRLNTLAADRAKTNFISSISHELRSPLHGVLASAELLKALTKDITSNDIINTIETCGSTLLDTMENLLTFTKINDIAVTQQQRVAIATLPSQQEIVAPSFQGLNEEVDLEHVIEEVINVNVSGHKFRMSLEMPVKSGPETANHASDSTIEEDSVTIVYDIDPQLKWMFVTQPGAWKRILMNLLGNSLKYTSSGYIYVRLSQVKQMAVSTELPKCLVSLTVEDTGKGISEEYMRHHLFKPFQQEDPLCSGTGLGLSIVHQLVACINGTIDVQSDVGYGTTIVVNALLESPPDIERHHLKNDYYSEKLSLSKAHTVGLVALDMYPEIQETPTGILSKNAKASLLLKSTLTQALEKTFGLQTVKIASLDLETRGVDILMTTESHFRMSQSTASRPRILPLIILCSALTLDYRPVCSINGPVMYLSQPFGPRRIARALEACIPYLDQKMPLMNALSGPLPIHTGTTSAINHFRQDSVDSPQISLLPQDLNSESVLQKKKRPQVLLVEDNPVNLKILVAFIGKLGYPYFTARDGLQAVEMYEKAIGKVDIIFMDIQMPNMDGFAASYKIRKFEQQHMIDRTTIVALTGLASVAVQEQATRSGMDFFLTKPVPLKKLKAVLEEHFPLPAQTIDQGVK